MAWGRQGRVEVIKVRCFLTTFVAHVSSRGSVGSDFIQLSMKPFRADYELNDMKFDMQYDNLILDEASTSI